VRDVSDAILSAKAFRVNEETPLVHRRVKTPMYCDCRALYSNPRQRTTVIEALLRAIKPTLRKRRRPAIAGIAVAGVPWAAMIADRLNLPLLVVRPERKKYGTRRLVEGDAAVGSHVVIIDDVLFSGTALLEAMSALRDEHLMPTIVATIVSYGNTNLSRALSRKRIQAVPLLRAEQLVADALSAGQISAAQAVVCNAFIEKLASRPLPSPFR
jgi:orotate phosphoribosyltransferase